ncbi:MAG TPA: glycerophosphodiester phosphodiesterase family protein [Sphingobacteriaceae bacterium]|nr:glycerophosphodiester phosphodiesterase family protein [Sphingobacteriaceae bacterium]
MLIKQFFPSFFVLCFLSLSSYAQQTVLSPVDRVAPEKTYKVVAHRGGWLECEEPDCSIASLKYAIQVGSYASELDIVITKDREVLVVHPHNGNLVNGLEPYAHTMAEIRAAGKLSNGEEIPTLQEYITVVMDPDQNPLGTKLWLDVKKLTKNRENVGLHYTIDACLRAAEIIRAMGAEEYCEFLIPTGEELLEAVRDRVADDFQINIAWMTPTDPQHYKQAWAQLPYASVFGPEAKLKPEDFFAAGVPLSVYGVNNAERMEVILPYYTRMKAVFTDYPLQLIEKLKAAGY